MPKGGVIMKKILFVLFVTLFLVVSCAPPAIQPEEKEPTEVEPEKEAEPTIVGVSPGQILHNGIHTSQSRDLWVINTDGTGLMQLINKYVPAKWSPNGEKIVYLYSNRLFSMNPDASAKREMRQGDKAITMFDWSSDSKYVLFEEGNGIGVEHMSNGLDLILTGEKVDQQPEGKSPTYSEKDTIAFISENKIYKVDVNGDNTEEWLDLSSPSLLKASPNGLMLAFSDAGSFYIVPNEKATTDRTKVASSEAKNAEWSPDSKKIAYKTGSGKFYIYNVETKVTSTVDKNSQDNFAWSPDSKWLAFTYKSPDTYEDIWFVKADGTGLRKFTNCPTACEKPSWG